MRLRTAAALLPVLLLAAPAAAQERAERGMLRAALLGSVAAA